MVCRRCEFWTRAKRRSGPCHIPWERVGEISFRDSLSGREAYLTGHRLAVWEVVAAHEEFQSVAKTAEHFRWPAVLVERALTYASEFPEEIKRSREGERPGRGA